MAMPNAYVHIYFWMLLPFWNSVNALQANAKKNFYEM